MLDTAIVVALVVWCLLAIVVAAVRLPGTWMVVVAAIAYGWWKEWQPIGAWTIAILIALAVVGEGLELLASVITARRGGASPRAAWGGLIGGIVGAFTLSFLVPIPLIGTVVGALAGCVGGAVIAEMSVHPSIGRSTRVGVFSGIGFAMGMLVKVGLTIAMSGIVLMAAYRGSLPVSLDKQPPLLKNIEDDSG
jgi:uncharacterized protein